MAGTRASINVRFSPRDREAVEGLVGEGKPYPTMSAFVERAVQHWLDHEKGLVLESGPALRRELADLFESDEGRAFLKEVVGSIQTEP